MKKILGVLGSPRKEGNTHVLISKILEGAKEVGAMGEILFLDDLDIKGCAGCFSCWKGNECSRKDDMNDLYPKIFESDVIIWGTPVYWYGPTALIKAFLDRFFYTTSPNNISKIQGKSAVIVIPFQEKNPEIASPLVHMFEKSFKYIKMDIVEKLIVPGVFKRGDVLKLKDVLEKAKEIGIQIGKDA
jgi:multimeric flavodoxin WrbA